MIYCVPRLAYCHFVSPQVFTGAVPFNGDTSVMAMLATTQGRRPPRPTDPACTENLWALMQRCWGHDPHSRPEVSEALRVLLTPSVSRSFRRSYIRSFDRFPTYSEDPTREQLTSDPSHNPAHAIPPIRNLSPPRPLSPLRDTTPPMPPSRAPARLHISTSFGAIIPTRIPPLPADASHRYRSTPRKVRVRQGFWNRRGDCATADGRYFIRAPPEHQNPPELAHLHQYHFSSYDGRTIPWDRRMKECPDSLQKHGQPPRYPFECVCASFIITGYFSNTLLQFLKYLEVDESDLRSPEFPLPY